MRRVLLAGALGVVVAGVLAIAVVAATLAYRLNALVAAALEPALGCAVKIEHVVPSLHAMRLEGLRATHCAGGVDVAVSAVQTGGPAMLVRRPRSITLRAHGATLGVAVPGATGITLRGVDGSVTRRADGLHGAIAFVLPGTTARVSVRGTSTPPRATFTLRAKRLRLAALVPLAAHLGVTQERLGVSVQGGDLEGVDVSVSTDGPRLSGGFTVRGGALAFGRHRLQALAGAVALTGDALATDSLTATLDDAPATFRGALHVAPHRGGGNDATALGELVARVADAALDDPDLGPLQSASFEALAPALLYADAHMTTKIGPRIIHVVAVDPHEPTIKVDTALAHDRLVSSGLRTSTLAAETGAAAGINGDYFDIGVTYQPQAMYVHDGKLLRSPTARSVLSILRNGRLAMSAYTFGGTVRDGKRVYRITRLNDFAEYVGVITPELGTLMPASSLTFAALTPLDAAGRRYRVTSIGPIMAREPARFGITFGYKITEPLPKVGDVVTLHYGTTPSLANVSAVIGGGPQLVAHGAWYEDPNPAAPEERDVRWPVVAAGRLADDRIDLVAVDGRHPEWAVGMTRPEFARLLIALGVVDAYALDSGGSVTMVSRTPFGGAVEVRNRPSDNDGERFVGNGLFVYSAAPPDAAPSPTHETRAAAASRP